jgi:hypothetical protein
METVTRATDLPIPALLGGGVEKLWVPDQGNNYRASVDKVDCHRVLGKTNILYPLFRLNFRTLHSISPIVCFRFPSTCVVRDEFHRAKSQMPGQREAPQPKLGRLIVTIDVNMQRSFGS